MNEEPAPLFSLPTGWEHWADRRVLTLLGIDLLCLTWAFKNHLFIEKGLHNPDLSFNLWILLLIFVTVLTVITRQAWAPLAWIAAYILLLVTPRRTPTLLPLALQPDSSRAAALLLASVVYFKLIDLLVLLAPMPDEKQSRWARFFSMRQLTRHFQPSTSASAPKLTPQHFTLASTFRLIAIVPALFWIAGLLLHGTHFDVLLKEYALLLPGASRWIVIAWILSGIVLIANLCFWLLQRHRLSAAQARLELNEIIAADLGNEFAMIAKQFAKRRRSS